MVKEAYPGRNVVSAFAVEDEGHTNLRLVCVANKLGFPHQSPPACCRLAAVPNCDQISCNAKMRRSVCEVVPSVMRTHPAQPGSEWRSRTRMPRLRIA